MGFQRRLKYLSLFFGALPMAVAAVVALYPVPSAHALKAVPAAINYDDPNMATTEGYVAEASIDCIKQGGSGTDVHSCMRGYSKPSAEKTADPDTEKKLAQKKDDADLTSSSHDSDTESK
jgi:hypothetical protein